MSSTTSLLNLGDPVVAYVDSNCTLKGIGFVRYIGFIEHGGMAQHVGIELIEAVQNGHDGTVNETRYFDAEDGYGVLVPIDNVLQVLDANGILLKLKTALQVFKQQIIFCCDLIQEQNEEIRQLQDAQKCIDVTSSSSSTHKLRITVAEPRDTNTPKSYVSITICVYHQLQPNLLIHSLTVHTDCAPNTPIMDVASPVFMQQFVHRLSCGEQSRETFDLPIFSPLNTPKLTPTPSLPLPKSPRSTGWKSPLKSPSKSPESPPVRRLTPSGINTWMEINTTPFSACYPIRESPVSPHSTHRPADSVASLRRIPKSPSEHSPSGGLTSDSSMSPMGDMPDIGNMEALESVAGGKQSQRGSDHLSAVSRREKEKKENLNMHGQTARRLELARNVSSGSSNDPVCRYNVQRYAVKKRRLYKQPVIEIRKKGKKKAVKSGVVRRKKSKNMQDQNGSRKSVLL